MSNNFPAPPRSPSPTDSVDTSPYPTEDEKDLSGEPIYSLNNLKAYRKKAYQSRRQLLVILILAACAIAWFVPAPALFSESLPKISISSIASPIQILGHQTKKPDPAQWLRENGNDKHAVQNAAFSRMSHSSRPKAALISLVRNQELDGLVQSMTQLEFHWNRKYQYPWIFFNDEPFSDEFKVGLL